MTAAPAVTLEAIGVLLDSLEQRIDQKFDSFRVVVDTKFEEVMTAIGSTDKSVHTLEKSVGTLEESVHKLENSVDTLEKSVHTLEKSVYSLQEAHMQHFQLTQDIQRRVVVLEDSVGDLQESLDFLTLAEEKDAEATINHEFRIARLEEHSGIQVISPTHLSDFE